MRFRRARLSMLLGLSLALSVVGAPLTMAEYHVGNSYFQGTPNGNYSFIPSQHRSSNSIKGSVMPNWGSYNTEAGGGALGEAALGINASDSNYDKKLKFFNFLKNKNQGVGIADAQARQWEQMGSALIVHQLLGKPQASGGWGNASRTIIDPDEWDALRARLVDNSNIYMNDGYVSQLVHENTAGIRVGPAYNIYDAIRYQYEQSDVDAGNIDEYVHSWIFTEGSGPGSTIRYQAEIICANPLGRLGGLPDAPPPPPQDYSLDPSVGSTVTSAEPGTDITIDGLVENVASNPSKETEWRLTQVVYGPGANPGTSGGDSTAQPCDFFSSAGRIPPPCVAVDSGINRVFDANTIAVVRDNYVFNVPLNADFGTRICFAVSVKPPTHLSTDQDKWRHSDLLCIMVSKSPKMQVWGGDVRANGSISTSKRSYTGPNRTYGSWAEYGALSNGGNSGFATGAGLNTGNVSDSQSSWSALTFANTGSAGPCRFGCYNFLLNSSGLIDQFIVASPPANPGSADLNTWGSGTYSAADLTLAGTTIGTGKSIIILATGTVTIQGDIAYHDGPYNNVRDIPQVVIRAPRINIQNSARRVDAWLLAVTGTESGIINTCSDIPLGDALTSNTCNNPLVVNGPVVTDNLYLYRTAGSGSQPNDRGTPAEIFNLRADAYLWGSSRGVGAEKARTVYTKELPPRF